MSTFGSVVRVASTLPKGSGDRKSLLRLAGKMKARLMEAWEALVEMVPSLPNELGDSYAESIAVSDVMKAYPREFSLNELYDVLDYMRSQPKHMRRVADKLNIDKAIKRPGRLHKYFGIPEDEKIPMAKIDAEIKKLKDKEDKSKEEDSLLDALYLGKRLKKMGARTDRQRLIRVAADLPKGSVERKAILAGLKTALSSDTKEGKQLKAMIDTLKLWRAQSVKAEKEFQKLLRRHGDWLVKYGRGKLVFSEPGDVGGYGDDIEMGWTPLKDVLNNTGTFDYLLYTIAKKGLFPMELVDPLMWMLGDDRSMGRAVRLDAAIKNLEYLQW